MFDTFKKLLKTTIANSGDLASGVGMVVERLGTMIRDGSTSNGFILLQSRYNGLQTQYNKGILTFAEYQISSNRIKESLLGMIDSLEEEDLDQQKMEAWLKEKEKENPAAPKEVPVVKTPDSDPDTNDSPIKVFISYSWDGKPHEAWVLHLAQQLAANGIEAILDQYELRLGGHLLHFMEKSVAESDRILLILTPNYKLKADGRKGGVGYEYSMINEEIYRNQANNEKFIPILREGNADTSVPQFLRPFVRLDMTDDSVFHENLDTLIRSIYNEHKVKKPPIGKPPKF